jgi:hypothetical protein
VVFSSPVKTAGAPPCGAQLLSSFIQDPTRDPDTSCLNDLLPVTFTASSKLDVQLFGTTDLWENSPPPQAAMPNDPAQAAAAALFDIQRTVAWGRWPVADAETSAR